MKKSTIFAFATALFASASAFAAEMPAYELTPAPGVAKNLETITLEFPTSKLVYFEENNRMPVGVLEYTSLDGQTTVTYVCEAADRITKAESEGVVYTLTFVEEDSEEAMPITSPGTYELTIKGLSLLPDIDATEGDVLEPINATYTIDYPVEVVFNPAGEVAEDLMEITVTYPENFVEFNGGSRACGVLENTTTNVSYYCQEPTRNTFAQVENGVEYVFTFVKEGEDDAAPIVEPGNYVFTIVSAFLPAEEEDGDPMFLPVLTKNYTIYPNVSYTLTPAPGNVEDLQTVSINFSDANVSFYENNRMPVAVLENVTTGQVYMAETADRDTHSTNEGVTYNFTFIEEGEEEATPIVGLGNYTLTIKGAYVTLEDEAGSEVMFDLPVINEVYSIEYPIEFTLDPSEVVVFDLEKVTLTFPNNKVNFIENMRPYVAALENTTTGDNYYCNEPMINTNAMTETGCEYTFVFIKEGEENAAPITEEGNYTLTIRGAYIPGENEDDNIDLPVINYNYTIFGEYEYVLTPEEGLLGEDADLQTITIEFPKTKAVNFYENNRMPVATLENLTTGEVYVCQEADLNTNAMSEGKEFTLNFVGEGEEEVYPIVNEGNYELTIRAMYAEVAVDSESEEAEFNTIDLPVIKANFTIYNDFVYVLTPAPGTVEEISTIVLDFTQTKNIAFYENNRMPVATLERIVAAATADDETEEPVDEAINYYCYEAERYAKYETNGAAYGLTFEAENAEEAATITVEGNYVLTIRALYAEAGEEMIDLPVIQENYVIAAGSKVAEFVDAEEGVYNVYTINGIQVVKNGDANSLNGLVPGLYIINGKKVLVRK